ncbi:MAG: CreA family protein [Reyranella sp.]|jgi:CreA protein|nr:CreA family protein [Reyranella sp.]
MLRALLAALLLLMPSLAFAETIGSVGYRFKWIGPNDKIAVEAFDDPDVAGVTCYISRARTGGIKGALGLAEDPSDASIACRQVGPIDVAQLDKIKSPHEVFSERASLIFKTTQVVRFWDAKRRVLVYLSYTDRIIEGSPKNSISVVPVGLK